MFGRTGFNKRILIILGCGASVVLLTNCAPLKTVITPEESTTKLKDSPVFADTQSGAAQGNIVVDPVNSGGNIVVQGGGSPTPTPSPTASPTPAPGSSPTPTPTSTPTPTPTPVPGQSPTPTATPHPGQSPTPTPTPTATPKPGVPPSPTPRPGSCHNGHAPSSSLPVFLVCSNRLSSQVGSLRTSTSLRIEMIPVHSSNGRHHSSRPNNSSAAACSFSVSGLGQEILRTRSFDLTLVDQNCPNLQQGSYEIRVIDPAPGMTGALNFDEIGGAGEPVVTKLGSGKWDVRPTDRLPLVAAAQHAGVICQLNRSPLMIRLEDRIADPERLVLTSPLAGISFDLLGQDAKPVPHTPVDISWFKENTTQYYFLALPDENGEVYGIDQLFGNDTMGPDGHLSANGFAALAKYDIRSAGAISQGVKMATPDKMITPEDPVFDKLRLWQDRNRDGRSQPGELFTLREMGFSAISLDYDPHYFEEDRHGNQIRFKSVVKTNDGRLHVVFDLWFAVGGGNF